ncbi:hypothetical protein B0T22DRAFT_457152 [Podospora appendiculata]|uniref:U-box domain-containing protein n=1 Tax=Podospora appendiculata TaxID=314037 RepID=A0AAE1CBD3_9PEZI|nr:hypothetical protein B0T22DRAFT_457152 [Podospora appendiculata]
MSDHRSALFKEEGNRHFQAGEYARAEALYSKALISDPNNPTLYTNRAMARLKLKQWESVIADCDACLKLSPQSMKANYYLSQAHLPLHNYQDALDHAVKAHELCVQTGDRSLPAITTQVLRCKKEKWDDQEKRRERQTSDLEREVVTMMQRERDEALRDATDAGDAGLHDIDAEWAAKIDTVRAIFEKARPKEEQRKVVPDWAIDDISFGFMLDPVITKSGKSYERASILEHLKRNHADPRDPLTRDPLQISDLRPNLDLKQACAEFLDENGWAADW